ncbi:MAG: hypothetical protein AB7W16_02475 [Candidatus Obscuribacterales bacterium]
MNDEVITADEIRCLRMWFRQAIAQLEQQEVTASIAAELELDKKPREGHRNSVVRRRSRRSRTIPHLRELVF